MNTKESVRERADKGQVALVEAMRLAYIDGRYDDGAMFGRRLHELTVARDGLTNCPYETGCAVDEAAKRVGVLIGPPAIRVMRGVDSIQIRLRTCPCPSCRDVFNGDGVESRGRVYCSQWCAQDFGEIPYIGTITHLARSVAVAVRDSAPASLTLKEAIREVARFFGV